MTDKIILSLQDYYLTEYDNDFITLSKFRSELEKKLKSNVNNQIKIVEMKKFNVNDTKYILSENSLEYFNIISDMFIKLYGTDRIYINKSSEDTDTIVKGYDNPYKNETVIIVRRTFNKINVLHIVLFIIIVIIIIYIIRLLYLLIK